jgi:bifunctional non-homologous end joining protein LigD
VSCFKGIVAKQCNSVYAPDKRSGAWQKVRVLQTREFVIGGYTPAGSNFDAILVCCYEPSELLYVAKMHGGFTPPPRRSVFKQFRRLETER